MAQSGFSTQNGRCSHQTCWESIALRAFTGRFCDYMVFLFKTISDAVNKSGIKQISDIVLLQNIYIFVDAGSSLVQVFLCAAANFDFRLRKCLWMMRTALCVRPLVF